MTRQTSAALIVASLSSVGLALAEQPARAQPTAGVPAYFTATPSLRMERSDGGVLTVTFNSRGGTHRFTAADHEAFVDAFYAIGRDRANKVVILTGAGGDWIGRHRLRQLRRRFRPGQLVEGARRRHAGPREPPQHPGSGDLRGRGQGLGALRILPDGQRRGRRAGCDLQRCAPLRGWNRAGRRHLYHMGILCRPGPCAGLAAQPEAALRGNRTRLGGWLRR
jgi:hypothetical protein